MCIARVYDNSIENYILSFVWTFSNIFYLFISIVFDLRYKRYDYKNFVPNKINKYSKLALIRREKQNEKNNFYSSLVIILLFVLYNFTPVFAPLKETILYTKYVSDNGFLHVDGTSIKNNKNNHFEIMGLSSHGLQWYNQLLTYDNLKTLKDTWKINVFRIAMYTDENGYINNKDEMKQKLIEITNNLIDLDMYVIIDWHTLKDNDPNKYKEDAKVFFDEISTLYKDSPNIIYEICNEPSGNTVTWDDQIKPYAEEIIPIIRKNAPKSLIIVGTPNWCKDLTSLLIIN